MKSTMGATVAKQGEAAVEDRICNAIMDIASVQTGREISSMDEVDALYNSVRYPHLNDAINYIIYGEC